MTATVDSLLRNLDEGLPFTVVLKRRTARYRYRAVRRADVGLIGEFVLRAVRDGLSLGDAARAIGIEEAVLQNAAEWLTDGRRLLERRGSDFDLTERGRSYALLYLEEPESIERTFEREEFTRSESDALARRIVDQDDPPQTVLEAVASSRAELDAQSEKAISDSLRDPWLSDLGLDADEERTEPFDLPVRLARSDDGVLAAVIERAEHAWLAALLPTDEEAWKATGVDVAGVPSIGVPRAWVRSEAIRREFLKTIRDARDSILILSPWIEAWGTDKGFFEHLPTDVPLLVGYGWSIDPSRDERESQDAHRQALNRLRARPKTVVVRIGNLHSKRVIVDHRTMLLGSYNFLSARSAERKEDCLRLGEESLDIVGHAVKDFSRAFLGAYVSEDRDDDGVVLKALLRPEERSVRK